MLFWQLDRFQEASSGDGRVKEIEVKAKFKFKEIKVEVKFKEIKVEVKFKEIEVKVKFKEIGLTGKGKNDHKKHLNQEDPHFSLSQSYFKQSSVKDQLMSNLSDVKSANKSPNCAHNANLWPSQ